MAKKTFQRNPFEITVDNPDFIRLKLRKSPEEIPFLSGFNLWEMVDDETGIPALLYMLGQLDRRHRGRAPWVIPVASDKATKPRIRGDRLYLADIGVGSNGDFELVQKHKDGTALRTFHTGLVTLNGGIKEHIYDLASNKRRIGFHGPVPLTAQGKIVGESIVMSPESTTLYDDRVGKIKGVAGVPEKRAVTIEGVIGGPVLNRQVDGMLTLHELTKNGWKVDDVTGDEVWEKMYVDLIMQDTEYQKAMAEDEKALAHRRRKFRVVRAPLDHVDG